MTDTTDPPAHTVQESEETNEVQPRIKDDFDERDLPTEDLKEDRVEEGGDKEEEEDSSIEDSSTEEEAESSSSSSSSTSGTSGPTRKPIPPKLSNKAKHSIHYTSLGSISQSIQDLKINENSRNPARNLLTGKKVVIKANGISYTTERVVGNGSFGVVFKATVVGTRDIVAIKKVLQDKRFKNRELQIMRMLDHPNVVKLHNSFYTNGDTAGEVYLNLVLEYVPETVYRVSRQYSKLRIPMPTIYIKMYMFQLCRAIAYIHSLGICHRDIKPQNLLIDPQACILKLCDFGSAKILVEGEPNVSYICSRYYRAPELIFGATNYTTAIDLWSTGCVMAELLLGQPLFPGSSGVDQLVEIIKVLGTPDRQEIMSMNKNYLDYNFPQIKGHDWKKIFRSRTPTDAIDLIQQLLVYTPLKRLHPLDACCHPFFDELRDPNCKLPNGRPLPPLFDFTEAELKHYSNAQALLPSHTATTRRSESSDTKAPEDEPSSS